MKSTCCSIAVTIFARTEGLPGPVIVKRFGKTRRAESEIGDRSRRPLVLESETASASNIDSLEGTGHRIESRCENDAVEGAFLAVRHDA